MTLPNWTTINPEGTRRVVVTKELPGERWQQLLIMADCRIDLCLSDVVLSSAEISAALEDGAAAAIGQLTETWDGDQLAVLRAAGGRVYSNYAVGFDNVDVAAATRLGLAVGNTPGVLTETTAQLAVALTFAAARRIAEGDAFMRAGRFARSGWLPTLLVGKLLWRKTVGVVGAGRIGAAYARMMVEGHKMDLVYFDPHRNAALEAYVADYAALLEQHGEEPVRCRRAADLDELLREADVVSLHAVLDQSTRHLIGAEQLALMKEDAIFINSSRGALHDEAALVAHCRANPRFSAALDVYEDEPRMALGLADLPNVVLVPHLGSATCWTREGMATLAAANVAAILSGWPVWDRADIVPFLLDPSPPAAPSIVNWRQLGLTSYGEQAS